ncbi:glycosyltransferase family 4 protein [Endothiovibrio diazotrophicus]
MVADGADDGGTMSGGNQDAILAAYAAGDRLAAARLALPTPQSCYDEACGTAGLGRLFAEYLDGMLFGGPVHAHRIQGWLEAYRQRSGDGRLTYDLLPGVSTLAYERIAAIVASGEISAELAAGFSLEHSSIRFPELGYWLMERLGRRLEPAQRAWVLERTPPPLRDSTARMLSILDGRLRLRAARPELLPALDDDAPPFLPFSFAPDDSARRAAEWVAETTTGIPLLLMELWELDWAEVLAPLEGRPALLLFVERTELMQALQFPAVVEALLDPAHRVLVLEAYPLAQWAARPAGWEGGRFAPLPLTPCPVMAAHAGLLAEAVAAALEDAASPVDTPAGDWLYRLGRKIVAARRYRRLGPSRELAIRTTDHQHHWRDSHKGEVPAGRSLGPPAVDRLKRQLDALRPRRSPRRIPAGRERLRLLHVTPQVVDGGHAPSRLLRTVIKHHDHARYEVAVLSTELLVERQGLYPIPRITSAPSSERAGETLAQWGNMGVTAYSLDGRGRFEESAEELADFLAELAVDVAVFHGPDEINLLASRLCEVPLKVFFDHHLLPPYGGFDLILASSEQGARGRADFHRSLGERVVANPFVVDVREEWSPAPFTKRDFGVSDGIRIMTTVSNHLEARLTSGVVDAFARILQQVPEAVYLPIGEVRDVPGFKARFAPYGVADRVIPIGFAADPTQYTRAMDLYLNEFPLGSGLALLDAMAAGLPIVTMYDPAGIPQARYGGEYFGVERAVTAGDVEGYVERAVRLLTDPALYREWSQAAVETHARRTDPRAYVARMEREIECSLAERSG